MSVMDDQPFNSPVIVDTHGKPARKAQDTACPRCWAGADKRIASCGFGVRRPCCGACGFIWADEVFTERERD